ncbi:16S rRNA (guanine(527)-N(7))-methyltransferase RsmG [Candidatus Babeliales bacterium]|nr:16S rRNA (guanine(527)-N(7))-methyltransferase RsmG [Candidatus Babeliales bacterium]
MANIKEKPAERVWAQFQKEIAMSEDQLHQFQRYAEVLLAENEKYNLTAINNLAGVVQQHFVDSLALGNSMDLSSISMIADVGSGAGFPAIPLKIMYPHLKIILIEVTYKKQLFLKELVDMLNLDNVDVVDLDWRTFIRTTEAPIDLFVTRAALGEVELTRAFRSTSAYRNATIVYWVSSIWECAEKVKKYFVKSFDYKVKHKNRKLAFFKNK